MLEQIFGSKTRVQIISLFIRNPDKNFYVREMVRITGQYINAIRRELFNLEQFGFLRSELKFQKKYYSADRSFFLFSDIENLFLKSKVFLENDLTNGLKKIGKIRFLVITGAFTGAQTPTDLLIVGDHIETREVIFILEQFGASIGQEIRYTLFSTEEYLYRRELADHFLDELFSQKHIVLVDKL